MSDTVVTSMKAIAEIDLQTTRIFFVAGSFLTHIRIADGQAKTYSQTKCCALLLDDGPYCIPVVDELSYDSICHPEIAGMPPTDRSRIKLWVGTNFNVDGSVNPNLPIRALCSIVSPAE